MTNKRRVDIARLLQEDEPVKEAIRLGIRDAMKRHIAGGVPMVTWRDGKIAYIQPEELIELLKEE